MVKNFLVRCTKTPSVPGKVAQHHLTGSMQEKGRFRVHRRIVGANFDAAFRVIAWKEKS